MSEQLIAVLWQVVLFIVPAVAILLAASLFTSSRRRDGQARQKVNGWIIAAAVILVGPMFASGAAAFAALRSGLGVAGLLPMWSGIGLLLLAGLWLAFVNARAAGLTLVILSILLPILVTVTGSAWVIDANALEPTPESVFLGTLAVIVLFSLPSLVSGVLLFVGSQRGEGTTDAYGNARSQSADASGVSSQQVTSLATPIARGAVSEPVGPTPV